MPHEPTKPGHRARGFPLCGGDPRAVAGDAPPTNRASNTCNGDGWFKALRWGVDSLYLSYQGRLHDGTQSELERLKTLAQSPEAHKQAAAQMVAPGHIFEVKDKGGGLFPFILEDNAFRISLSRNKAKSLPMAYVKVSSDYLAHVTPEEAETRLGVVLREWGELSEIAAVSRLDLFVDFESGLNMESWGREAWVTRASSINSYSVDSMFSGWTVGLGGPISARLYDKTLEIAVKRYRDYLPPLWRSAGWHGDERVWRLEFQFRREILSQKGLKSFLDVMGNLAGLWSYGTTEWLRLCIPSADDKTRSRWPVHPLWSLLASIDWGTPAGPLSRNFSPARRPPDSFIYGRSLSALVCFMAREGITDYAEAESIYLSYVRSYHERLCHEFIGVPFEQYVAEKVRLKARDYNTILNPKGEERVRSGTADDYRSASDGFNPFGDEE